MLVTHPVAVTMCWTCWTLQTTWFLLASTGHRVGSSKAFFSLRLNKSRRKDVQTAWLMKFIEKTYFCLVNETYSHMIIYQDEASFQWPSFVSPMFQAPNASQTMSSWRLFSWTQAFSSMGNTTSPIQSKQEEFVFSACVLLAKMLIFLSGSEGGGMSNSSALPLEAWPKSELAPVEAMVEPKRLALDLGQLENSPGGNRQFFGSLVWTQKKHKNKKQWCWSLGFRTELLKAQSLELFMVLHQFSTSFHPGLNQRCSQALDQLTQSNSQFTKPLSFCTLQMKVQSLEREFLLQPMEGQQCLSMDGIHQQFWDKGQVEISIFMPMKATSLGWSFWGSSNNFEDLLGIANVLPIWGL